MRCPFCGNEMTSGAVQSGRVFFFATEPHNVWLWPNAAKGDFILSSDNWTIPTCVAYHCPECKKVVLDYEKEIK